MSDVIVIPGFAYSLNKYSDMFDYFSEDYSIHLFPVNYDNKNAEIVENLSFFLAHNGIEECHFITHSYGAVILRLFYQERAEVFKRSVELGPPNQGSEVLETFGHYPFLEHILGRAYKEFLEHEKEIQKLPYPPRTGVLAGSKHFSLTRPEAYFILLIVDVHFSDGKVKIKETKFDGMEDFDVIDEYHTYLISNKEVFERINNFFGKGKFKKSKGKN